VKKLTEKLGGYRGREERNPDDFRRFKDKILDLTKDELWEGYSKNDGKELLWTPGKKFYLTNIDMFKVFKKGFPVEYMMTSFEDVDVFKHKNGLIIKTRGKYVEKEYLHEFILLPACKENYHRDWSKDGICIKEGKL
jgi:hypothetical protein